VHSACIVLMARQHTTVHDTCASLEVRACPATGVRVASTNVAFEKMPYLLATMWCLKSNLYAYLVDVAGAEQR
jgi:hypothetical protein